MKRETTSAIICNTTEDFEMWSIIKKHKPSARRSRRDYTYKGNRYICIISPENCRGYVFDEIIETDSAYLNKRYVNIVDSAKMCLVSVLNKIK